MTLWRDPRVLGDEWCPPRLIGRDEVLRDLAELRPVPFHPHPRAVVVLHGPRGSGTSALARKFGRELFDAWSSGSSRRPPLWLRADVARAQSPCRAVLELFQGIDPSTHARGASTEQMVLLLLRRLRTLQRPTILWLDQVRRTGTEVGRLLSPWRDPAAFLPEGGMGLPLLAVLVSGEVDPLEDLPGIAPDPSMPVLSRRLAPLSPSELLEALSDRARLAFEDPPRRETLEAVRDLLLAHGWGLSAAGMVLEESARRAQQRGSRRILPEDVHRPADLHVAHRTAKLFDLLVIRTLRELSTPKGTPVPVRVLRSVLHERCRQEGLPAPTQARLWRHLVALEASGAFQREVQLGGRGGSSTRLRVPSARPTAPRNVAGHLPGVERREGHEELLTRVRPLGPVAFPPVAATPPGALREGSPLPHLGV